MLFFPAITIHLSRRRWLNWRPTSDCHSTLHPTSRSYLIRHNLGNLSKYFKNLQYLKFGAMEAACGKQQGSEMNRMNSKAGYLGAAGLQISKAGRWIGGPAKQIIWRKGEGGVGINNAMEESDDFLSHPLGLFLNQRRHAMLCQVNLID
jgi:hypothetical protein